MLSDLDVGFLVLAGVLAGLAGTAGAITSLISYPALLVVGIPPLTAGVANIVALTASWPGSALSSGPELAGRGPWLWRRAPVAALGGLVGAALLLSTSAGAFVDIVPFLVAGGSLTLLAAPRLTARRGAVASGREPRGTAAAILIVSVYNGYFGAGAGVMLLALCLVCVDPALPVANALKNMLVGAATIAGALALLSFGHVRWDAVVPLGIGVFAGGTLGPRLARRIPERVLRPLVAAFGIGLAIQLWLSHGA
jgi:uncharacterized membrane protein YfcA